MGTKTLGLVSLAVSSVMSFGRGARIGKSPFGRRGRIWIVIKPNGTPGDIWALWGLWGDCGDCGTAAVSTLRKLVEYICSPLNVVGAGRSAAAFVRKRCGLNIEPSTIRQTTKGAGVVGDGKAGCGRVGRCRPAGLCDA